MSGRPKGGANRRFSKEDKLIILSDYLEKGMTQIEVITKYGIAVHCLENGLTAIRNSVQKD